LPETAAMHRLGFDLCSSHFEIANDIVDIDPLSEEQRNAIGQRLQKAGNACSRAVDLDPSYAAAYAVAGTFAWSSGRPSEGEELYLKGIALDPNDGVLLFNYGSRLAVAGRLKQALPLLLKSHALEPFSPVPARYAVSVLWLNGNNEEAIAHANNLLPIDRANNLAKIYNSMGRFREAPSPRP
jgi:tetratricopeptide (TPR) repeat protein